MSRKKAREFWCAVVSEMVGIRLRRADGFEPERGFFVQCNQTECQYVDENAPPCPLNVGMFAEEIKAVEVARASRNE
ncbi:MAG: hypothetical protein DMD83_23620 [Candidatus Rokuibacteriota bacterium]|nr:MAG: hypothetical protein DMD83_23620 [Candidatus Rokubacteria bacterium]